MEVNLYSCILLPSKEISAFLTSMISGASDAPLFQEEVQEDQLLSIFLALENIPVADSSEILVSSSGQERLFSDWSLTDREIEDVFDCLKRLKDIQSSHYISTDEGYIGAASISGGVYTDYTSWNSVGIDQWDVYDLLSSMANSLEGSSRDH